MKLEIIESASHFEAQLTAETVEEAAKLTRLGLNAQKGQIDIRTMFYGNNIDSNIFVKYRRNKRNSVGNGDKR
jgi:uncharacterized protein (UPF0333 family)